MFIKHIIFNEAILKWSLPVRPEALKLRFSVLLQYDIEPNQ